MATIFYDGQIIVYNPAYVQDPPIRLDSSQLMTKPGTLNGKFPDQSFSGVKHFIYTEAIPASGRIIVLLPNSSSLNANNSSFGASSTGAANISVSYSPYEDVKKDHDAWKATGAAPVFGIYIPKTPLSNSSTPIDVPATAVHITGVAGVVVTVWGA